MYPHGRKNKAVHVHTCSYNYFKICSCGGGGGGEGMNSHSPLDRNLKSFRQIAHVGGWVGGGGGGVYGY